MNEDKPYAVLLNEYQLFLETKEWKSKRASIINRDGNKCCRCNKGNISKFANGFTYQVIGETPSNHLEFSDKLLCLQVHHTYYVKGNLPWDYPDESLVTLCNRCHTSLHSHILIPKLEKSQGGNLLLVNTGVCKKCTGVGWIPKYDYFMEGICFDCWGKGTVNETMQMVERDMDNTFFVYRGINSPNEMFDSESYTLAFIDVYDPREPDLNFSANENIYFPMLTNCRIKVNEHSPESKRRLIIIERKCIDIIKHYSNKKGLRLVSRFRKNPCFVNQNPIGITFENENIIKWYYENLVVDYDNKEEIKPPPSGLITSYTNPINVD